MLTLVVASQRLR
jgi:hypothetical protein